jgi:putative membrane protein
MPAASVGHGALSMHDGAPVAPHDLPGAWSTDPFVLVPIVVFVAAWVIGWRRMALNDPWRMASGVGGWAVLVIALLSPLHAAATALFSVHMGQHVLLMSVAAPLLVVARPVGPLVKAVPAWTPALTRVLRQRWITRLLTPDVVVAWSLHAIVLWVWHAPVFYNRTLESDVWHATQHVTLLASALLFWQSVLRGRHAGSSRWAAIGVISLFTTGLHATALGALLALFDTPLYDGHAQSTQAWGLSPLEDQQLAGLIMWVPGCLPYAVGGIMLLKTLLREPRATAFGTH